MEGEGERYFPSQPTHSYGLLFIFLQLIFYVVQVSISVVQVHSPEMAALCPLSSLLHPVVEFLCLLPLCHSLDISRYLYHPPQLLPLSTLQKVSLYMQPTASQLWDRSSPLFLHYLVVLSIGADMFTVVGQISPLSLNSRNLRCWFSQSHSSAGNLSPLSPPQKYSLKVQ